MDKRDGIGLTIPRRAVSLFSLSTYCVRSGTALPQTAEPVPGLRVPISFRVRTLSRRTVKNHAG